MKLKVLSLAVALALTAFTAYAQQSAHQSSGKVTKVDPKASSVTIAHAPIPAMKWPAMTMQFKVRDKALLDKLKPGEKIDFTFVQSGKDYVITEAK